MRDLTPHVDYRTRYLQDEADARRLAASAAGPAPGPGSPSARRRVVATSILALLIAIGSSGAYLALAAEPTGSVSAPSTASPGALAPAPAVRDLPTMPPSGGLVMHR